MYLEIKTIHSLFAYFSIGILVLAIFYNLYAFVAKQVFTKTNKMLSLSAMIAAHIQLLLGILVYGISPLGFSNFSGAAMKDATSRLYILEHPLMMIIGIILITVGYMVAKRKSADIAKQKTILIYYTIGLVIILSRIPWSTWL